MSLQKKSDLSQQQGPSYDQIKQRWKQFSPVYVQFDSTPQTFFYTLANMLKLNQSKNVLEIACGAGLLIPHVLDLKSPETFYYATDITSQMVELAKKRLAKHFEKYQSNLNLDQWMQKQRLEFAVVNGEEKIPKEIKFDRIICNLVLMLTSNPKKMLNNLYESAEDGCLMGLTVWGERQHSNLFSFMQDLMKEHELPGSKKRSNFYLNHKIQDLVEQCGWQKVLSWNQTSMFPIIEHSSQKLHTFIEKDVLLKFPKELHPKVLQRIDEYVNKQKCGLTFGGKLMIVRKKSKKQSE